MNDITYKNYLISVKEGMIVVKIKGGVGGWVLHFLMIRLIGYNILKTILIINFLYKIKRMVEYNN
jgi:hypothetical protein